jgi:general secretion pathway protein G
MFEIDKGRFPTQKEGLAILAKNAGKDPDWRAYIDKLPVDPWGHAYIYKIPGAKGELLSKVVDEA